MDLGLHGHIALVTGASQGIGRDIARTLAGEGCCVWLTARSETALAAVQREIRAAGGQAEVCTADLTDAAAVARLMATIERVHGRLDVLVNNAGGAPRFADFFALSEADWLETFQLNVMSVVRCVQTAVPLLRRATAPRIVNVTSLAGLEPSAYNPHYAMTKAAVLNLSKSLANALARDGILVNSVCPGPVHSEAWDRNLAHVAEQRGITVDAARAQVEHEEASKVPLRRIGEGRDVAAVVAWLCAPTTQWITGACIPVDGGKRRAMG